MARTQRRTNPRPLNWLVAGALALSGAAILAGPARQAKADTGPVITGSFQSELGCTGGAQAGDWVLDCPATAMTQVSPTSNLWSVTLTLPAGDFAYKAVEGANWANAYPAEDVPLHLDQATELKFVFDTGTKQVGLDIGQLAGAYQAADDAANIHQPAVDAAGGQQFYFVLTDRFKDGDPTNNEGGLTGDRLVTGYDPADSAFYMGGDIQGLIQELDYIQNLGTTAIWLSPSFTNRPVQGVGDQATAGYHGYWITDFTNIDPHLGGNAALTQLITAAHARGIKVYFDIIANHTADVTKYYGTNTAAASIRNENLGGDVACYDNDGQAVGPASTPWGGGQTYVSLAQYPFNNGSVDADTSYPYKPCRPEGTQNLLVPSELNDLTLYHNRGDGIMEYAGPEEATLGDFNSLDDLATDDPRVVALMTDIYTAWMDMGVDGFRIDTVKHVDFEFWQQFTQVIAAHDPDFFTFGEVFEGAVTTTSPYVRDTDMNAVLDFPLELTLRDYLKGGAGSSLQGLFQADDYYTTDHSDARDLPTFLDNHDMGRIGYLLAGQSDLDKRVALGHSLMFLVRGQPVVYYGDEQGFVGSGGDRAARQVMFANAANPFAGEADLYGAALGTGAHFNQTSPLYEHIQDLAALRQQYPALVTGAQIDLGAQWSGYAFSRVDRTEQREFVVGVNSGTLP
ncbi:MAG: hypothetical protein LBR19_06990, partial [Bifidobacteriaceae bacterium]|nr:hypothetical protein [Bifidobacteriaceae bacterium]